MKSIALSHGKFALVDDEDYERVIQHKWHSDKNASSLGLYYAKTKIDGRTVRLHQFVLGIKSVDHKNGNGLDNQKSNLRPATQSQNKANQRKQIGTSSIHKGVCFLKKYKKPSWVAGIKVNGCRIYLGTYSSENDAAISYNHAAKAFFGDFARLNTI